MLLQGKSTATTVNSVNDDIAPVAGPSHVTVVPAPAAHVTAVPPAVAAAIAPPPAVTTSLSPERVEVISDIVEMSSSCELDVNEDLLSEACEVAEREDIKKQILGNIPMNFSNCEVNFSHVTFNFNIKK